MKNDCKDCNKNVEFAKEIGCVDKNQKAKAKNVEFANELCEGCDKK